MFFCAHLELTIPNHLLASLLRICNHNVALKKAAQNIFKHEWRDFDSSILFTFLSKFTHKSVII